MKRFPQYALSLLLLLNAGQAHSAPASSSECPQNASEWPAWRSGLLDQVRKLGYGAGFSYVRQRLSVCDSDIQSTIAIAGSIVDINPNHVEAYQPGLRQKFDACFGPLKSTIDYYRSRPNSFEPDGENYRKKAVQVNPKSVELPPELASDPEFLELMTKGFLKGATDPQKRAAAIAKMTALVAQKNPGAKVLVYDSKHFAGPGLGNGDNGRLLIFYPGEDVDRWLQIGVPRKPMDSAPTNVSIVSVVKKDKGGKTLTPPQSYFQDVSVDRDTRKYRNATDTVNCTQCHTNGPIPIWPNPFGGAPVDQSAVSEINEAMSSHGLITMPGLPTLTPPGAPTLGMVAKRDPNNLPGCNSTTFTQLDNEGKKHVAAAMNCASCHNGKSRATLPARQTQTINTSIVKGFMPPGNSLTEAERSALNSCLQGEVSGDFPAGQEGIVVQKLRSTPCDVGDLPRLPDQSATFDSTGTKPLSPETGTSEKKSPTAGGAK